MMPSGGPAQSELDRLTADLRVFDINGIERAAWGWLGLRTLRRQNSVHLSDNRVVNAQSPRLDLSALAWDLDGNASHVSAPSLVAKQQRHLNFLVRVAVNDLAHRQRCMFGNIAAVGDNLDPIILT